MQVDVKDAQHEFKPITITLEITSRHELAALWHRLDVGGAYLHRRYLESTPQVHFPETWRDAEAGAVDETEPLFKAVDNLAVSRGLRSGGKVGH